MISIHAPTWGATDKTPGKPPWSYISIHAPTWGATHLPRWILSPWTISIHAPTWGATRQHIPGVTATRYFNPRSHVGSDIFYMHGTCHKGDFNPRSHVGSDLDSILHHTRLEISIHAPTWGATRQHIPGVTATRHFNPRSHVGSDTESLCRFMIGWRFQSTLPRGERQSQLII